MGVDALAERRARLLEFAEVLVFRACAQYWDLPGRQSRWADRQSWTLEERPPHLFREIEERIAAANRVAEEQRIAAEKAAEGARREAKERERQRHLLIDQANKRLVETHRATHLRARAADAWGPNRPTSVTPATSPTSRPSTRGRRNADRPKAPRCRFFLVARAL